MRERLLLIVALAVLAATGVAGVATASSPAAMAYVTTETGVVTMIISARGSMRARPIWMSPVPGGMSISRKSRSPQ
jgi:hypothetical protein